MRCPKCGFSMMEGDRYLGGEIVGSEYLCPNCGFRIIEQTADQAKRENKILKKMVRGRWR
jgi:DNA-directed RNA polymerase subunit RPC12/RpoP